MFPTDKSYYLSSQVHSKEEKDKHIMDCQGGINLPHREHFLFVFKSPGTDKALKWF